MAQQANISTLSWKAGSTKSPARVDLSSEIDCANDWHLHNGACYRVTGATTSWSAASGACRGLDSKSAVVADPTSQSELTALVTMLEGVGALSVLADEETGDTARGAWLGGRFWDGFPGHATPRRRVSTGGSDHPQWTPASKQPWTSGQGWYSNDGKLIDMNSFETDPAGAKHISYTRSIEFKRTGGCMLLLLFDKMAPKVRVTSKCVHCVYLDGKSTRADIFLYRL
jgi:hypothetical protein